MEGVGIHRQGVVEPAFRQGVLAVVAVAYGGVISALFASGFPSLGGIHVPDFTVGVDV